MNAFRLVWLVTSPVRKEVDLLTLSSTRRMNRSLFELDDRIRDGRVPNTFKYVKARVDGGYDLTSHKLCSSDRRRAEEEKRSMNVEWILLSHEEVKSSAIAITAVDV
jgi:hypothetical protein